MKIARIMTRIPSILRTEATALQAAMKMQDIGCGILPVGNDHRHIVGVITDRDIMERAITKNQILNETPVIDIMSTNVIFSNETDSLQQAIQQMKQHNIRRVLVRDANQNLTGILSLGDILRRVEDKTWLTTLFVVEVID